MQVRARRLSIANFASSSHDARELRENLCTARKKPVRTAIGGQVWMLKVDVGDSFGEDAFKVRIDPAPELEPSATPPSVHQMIKTLELSGFIKRTPGQARSIRLLVRPEHLPTLG